MLHDNALYKFNIDIDIDRASLYLASAKLYCLAVFLVYLMNVEQLQVSADL